MSRSQQRTFTSDVGELRRMSAWWCEWAAAGGLSAGAMDRGELCLNEAAGNIIQHGGRPCAITITYEQEDDTVRMIIADDGDSFDPLTHPMAELARTLDEAQPGGLGLRILHDFADAVAYRRIDGRNVLTLTLKQ